MDDPEFAVVIVGGSNAGLSAAMALGRSLRTVLIVDSGLPCNRQTPRAHNFITHDGTPPAAILEQARSQVLAYPSVTFRNDLVVSVEPTNRGFRIRSLDSGPVHAKKVLFATGIRDRLPDTPGFAECWGISVLHCPYCHGYEVAGKTLGIIANGELAIELSTLIRQWSGDLTLFTDGPADLAASQRLLLDQLGIGVVEGKIGALLHHDGYIDRLIFVDGPTVEVDAVFPGSPSNSTAPYRLL